LIDLEWNEVSFTDIGIMRQAHSETLIERTALRSLWRIKRDPALNLDHGRGGIRTSSSQPVLRMKEPLLKVAPGL
jgi:hypothetical protein